MLENLLNIKCYLISKSWLLLKLAIFVFFFLFFLLVNRCIFYDRQYFILKLVSKTMYQNNVPISHYVQYGDEIFYEFFSAPVKINKI